jgi:leishmanolysin-like peptidase
VLQRWSEMLNVMPVEGPLYAHRGCLAYWTSDTVLPNRCGMLDLQPQCQATDGDPIIVIDPDYLGEDIAYPNDQNTPVTYPAGAGVADTDFVLYVTAMQTPSCGSAGMDVLAYGLTCQRDQHDRPTFGRVNFCPSALDTNAANVESEIGVALHEVAHALGFSATSWFLFRDELGNPRTPRDPRYPDYPDESTYGREFSCGGVDIFNYLPSDNTVAYVSERGMDCTRLNQQPPYQAPEMCVAKMVTPAVTAAARLFFNCPTLNGAELENQLTTACDLQGSHWEQRILNTELMSSYVTHAALVSPITLAAFEDSGWYMPNYDAADGWKDKMDWGFKQGCTFATSTCLRKGATTGPGLGNPPHFYADARALKSSGSNAVCTTDRLAVGQVRVSQYNGNLPTQYQYYSDPTVGGGSSETLDFCPAIEAYTNRMCAVAANQDVNAYKYGETYGPGSMCATSTLRLTGFTEGLGAGCYEMMCVTGSSPAVHITVTSNGNSENVHCTTADANVAKSVPGYSGTITCPDFAIFCADRIKLSPDAEPTAQPSPDVDPSPGPGPHDHGNAAFSVQGGSSWIAIVVAMVVALLSTAGTA